MSQQPSNRARRRPHPDQREALAVAPARPEPEQADERRADLAAASREITLPGLVLTLRRGWWLLASTVLVCVVVVSGMLKMSEPVYTPTMVVAPAERDLGAARRLATDLDRYANLATLAQTPVKLEQVSAMERCKGSGYGAAGGPAAVAPEPLALVAVRRGRSSISSCGGGRAPLHRALRRAR